MSPLPQEIAPGLWRWTARHPEWHPAEFGDEVASYAADADGHTVLIDPLLPEDPDATLAALDAIVRDRVAILTSIPYHVRSAEALAERYGAAIHGHPAVARRLRDRARLAAIDPEHDAELPGGVRAFAIGRPRRYEMPLWLPAHAALVFGDAVVEVGGQLRVWVQEPASDRRRRFIRERFAPTFAPLLELGAERVLVTHGEPVLSGGAAELARALEREPFWHHG